VEHALQYRLHEVDRQVAAIREGMGWIIPVPLLSLLTAEKLEQMVCGSEEVSIDMLKKVARFVVCVIFLLNCHETAVTLLNKRIRNLGQHFETRG